MNPMKALLVLAFLPLSAHAQTIVVRPMNGAPLIAPAPRTFSPAALTVSVMPALSLSPSLAASAVPVALVPVPATPQAAAPIRAAEFGQLVADLMGSDAEKAEAATAALRALKDKHLNADTNGKKTPVLDLKPMQIPAGMIEVLEKANDLRDMKPKQVEAWLKERSVPILEDYKGRKRPVDHHHETRAAWEAGRDEVYAYHYFDDSMHARIKALPRAQYYAVTRAMGLWYDRDQFGAGPHDPNHLPEDVRGMADDPFRSVAWQVRKRGGYDKTSVPFAEFAWARYFRERVATYPTKADFEKAVREALAIARDPAARDLPGYKAK